MCAHCLPPLDRTSGGQAPNLICSLEIDPDLNTESLDDLRIAGLIQQADCEAPPSSSSGWISGMVLGTQPAWCAAQGRCCCCCS